MLLRLKLRLRLINRLRKQLKLPSNNKLQKPNHKNNKFKLKLFLLINRLLMLKLLQLLKLKLRPKLKFKLRLKFNRLTPNKLLKSKLRILKLRLRPRRNKLKLSQMLNRPTHLKKMWRLKPNRRLEPE